MRLQLAVFAQKSAQPALMSAHSIKWTIAKGVRKLADSVRLSASGWRLKRKPPQK